MKGLICSVEHDGEKEWLIVKKKKFPRHGHLTDTESAGNGYHGRCSNCGMPLVTDLGYNSWNGTKCEIKATTKREVNLNFKWTKSKDRATQLCKTDCYNYISKLVQQQGWGQYNFQPLFI